jgi:branched-subunit amino acid aminotransferase/4-amino-4-deoxychorismate lyase
MAPAPPAPIAWIGDPASPERGQWGPPGELTVPLDERGLLLADGLFETLLVERGRIRLLEEHLDRWRQGAQLLALPAPPARDLLLPLVAAAANRSGIGSGALRLNWSRGSAGPTSRGLDLPPANATTARFWLQLTAATPSFEPLSTIISQRERRNPSSLLSRCKTFAYAAQIQARREAREAGADEALLLATGGELSCGAAANLLVRREGTWLTPSLCSGCLPGVMRGRALRLGVAREEILEPQVLELCEGALLINSLGCRPIQRCDGRPLPYLTAAAAAGLWRAWLEGENPPATTT